MHDLLESVEKVPSLSEDSEKHLYEFIRCRGCDTALIIHRWTDDGGGVWTVEYYPPRLERPIPNWMPLLRGTSTVRDASYFVELLDEIYSATAAGLYRLAVMGIGTLIETIMIRSVGDGGAFAKTLDAFLKDGHIGLVQHDTLKNSSYVRNAVVHRAFDPSQDEVFMLLDVVEALLEDIVIHPESSAKAADRVPPRPPKR